MKTTTELRKKITETRQAMALAGWNVLDPNREEPCCESVSFVALNGLLRLNLDHLSIKATTQISTFVEYLSLCVRRLSANRNKASLLEAKDVCAYLCATSLFVAVGVISSGGVWHGIDEEMTQGDKEPDPTLDDWREDSIFFWEYTGDLGVDDIVNSLHRRA